MGATTKSRIGIIILAAGASSPLGQPKQLLKFQGKTLIRHAAENALATGCENIIVVLGANITESKKEIADLLLETTVNNEWENGMSSSVVAGLEKLLETQPNLSAVIIQLCDQPLVDANILNKLIAVYNETNARIVASEYAGTVGVPALFDQTLFSELLNLSAEMGAKKVIKKYLDSVKKVSVPEAEIDVDTIADYKKLRSEYD